MPSASSAGVSVVTVPLSARAERRNLLLRILSGLVLAPPVLLLAVLGGGWFALGLAIAAALGYREWLRIVAGRPPVLGYLALISTLGAYWRFGSGAALVVLGLMSLTLVLVGLLEKRRHPWFEALGLPYVALTMVVLPWLRDSRDASWPIVIFVFLVVWGTDIGAYFCGRFFGGPRLAPRISPNKTWAGLAGGVAVAATVALAWALILHIRAPLYSMIIAIALSLVGQAGDLFESSVKRRFQLKDSGELIPGHGGMLDRIDALLWVAPAFALLYAFGGTAGLKP
jgi:phosphatidate cytidylyltransferase